MSGIENGAVAAHDSKVALRVRYAPAKKPYVEPQAPASWTLQEVKTRALNEFKLVEGPVEGGAKSYQFSYDDEVQSNLNVTLGSLVKNGKQLQLLLIEQFTQG